MTSKIQWSFRVNWIGTEHILVAYKKQDSSEWSEFLLTVKEYAEFMQLLQEFNSAFREQIDQKLVESYLNE